MALGTATDAVVDNPNTHSISVNEQDGLSSKYEGGAFGASDPEQGTGEPKFRKMSRIGGPISGMVGDSDTDSTISVGKQVELERANAIKYRTCSWQKTAALLFAEYICLAIMSFPYSYSVLGLVPGLIITVVVAALVLYTSLIVW